MKAFPVQRQPRSGQVCRDGVEESLATPFLRRYRRMVSIELPPASTAKDQDPPPQKQPASQRPEQILRMLLPEEERHHRIYQNGLSHIRCTTEKEQSHCLIESGDVRNGLMTWTLRPCNSFRRGYFDTLRFNLLG